MDLGKLVLFAVVGVVALWVLSIFFRVFAGLVSFLLPVAIIVGVGYLVAKAFGWVKS